MSLPISQLHVKKSDYNENIEAELAALPFADFVATGQKRSWGEFTAEEKKQLATKYPARNDLPYPIRLITALSTAQAMNQPDNYYRVLKASGNGVSNIVQGIDDPRGFTSGVCILKQPCFSVYLCFVLFLFFACKDSFLLAFLS